MSSLFYPYTRLHLFRLSSRYRRAVDGRRVVYGVDDQHILAKVELRVRVDDLPAAVVELHVRVSRHSLRDRQKLCVQPVAVDAVDVAHRGGDFLEVPHEDLTAIALLSHTEPLADVHAQLPADCLQTEANLFLNLRIA